MRALRWLWTWAWIPCSMLIVLAATWGWSVYAHFSYFAVRLDPHSSGLELGKQARADLRVRWRKLVGPEVAANGLLRVGLSVPQIADLDRRQPYSGREYVRATFSQGAKRFQVAVRYRGDLYVHWGRRKKSWRVRTAKGQLFRGMRKFNLIAPKTIECLNNYLSAWLAHEMGLIAPRVDLVRLEVNGEDRGVHILVEQVDETLLRARRRLPGAVYSGDAFMLGTWSGVPNDLFARAGIWKQTEKRKIDPELRRAPLEQLCTLLREPSSATTARALARMIDLDRFASFSLLEELTQSSHVDTTHNWKLYWDPRLRVFEPIVWDIVGWQEGWRPAPGFERFAHAAWTSLHDALYSNVAFLVARDRARAAFARTKLGDKLIAELERCEGLLDRALPSDALRFAVSESEQAAARERFADFVRTSVRAFERSLGGDEELHWTQQGGELRLSLRSRRPAHALSLLMASRASARAIRALSLRIPREGSDEVVDLAGRWQVHDRYLRIDLSLASAFERHLGFDGHDPVRNRRLSPRATTFALTLVGAEPDSVKRVFATRSRSAEFRRVEAIALRPVGDLWLGSARSGSVQTWKGVIDVVDSRELEHAVRIEPGTTIRLSAGASLVFRAGLHAAGSVERPIRFVGEDWGAVVIRGDKQAVLEHCHFVGGHGARDALGSYSGSLSIYGVERASLRDCSFEAVAACEDVVHVVRSELRCERCSFTGGVDGLDLDLSTAFVRDCRFSSTSGDAVDLMESYAVIAGSSFAKHGDKAVSVGERSHCLLTDCRLRDCAIGCEVKDASVATLVHCDVRACAVALRAYEKNWRYESGGRLCVVRSVFADNEQHCRALGRSSIELIDCQLAHMPSASDGPSGVRVEHCGPEPRARASIRLTDLPLHKTIEQLVPRGPRLSQRRGPKSKAGGPR